MPTTATATSPTPQELNYRVNDGIHVTLLWYPATNRVTVEVYDESVGESFELEVPAESALDAFHHPYAYAAFSGTPYPAREREALRV